MTHSRAASAPYTWDDYDVQLYRKGNEPAPDQDPGLIRGRPDLVVEVVSPRASATVA